MIVAHNDSRIKNVVREILVKQKSKAYKSMWFSKVIGISEFANN